MRRLLFLMPILLCAAVSAHAQSLDAFKQRLAVNSSVLLLQELY
jgi:hypothetical protein